MKILLIILLFTVSTVAQKYPVDKTEWTFITSTLVDESKPVFEVYWYRNDSVVRKTTVKFWSRQQKYDSGWIPGHSMSLIEFNCAEQTMNIRQLIDYDAKGNVASTLDNVTKGFEDVPPDTLGSTMMKKMCAVK